MKLEAMKKVQEVLYSYESKEEWIEEYNKMLSYGWECYGKSYIDGDRYYQKYSKKIDY